MVSDGGTGQKFTNATTIVAGVASFSATVLSAVSIWLQTKNYRKPLLQRYVVRILLMVPIYSIASFTSMISLKAAQFVDPIRDIYEAFTIYTFFHLLINYLGGERSLIVMTHGRAPVQHLWPLNHVLAKVDISDPHTFLSIKRGILQYAWLKPILAIAAIVMKATGTYKEGYLDTTSGYLWSGIIYNISVTLSLYSLGLFWVCMHNDLVPFRPVPKFLCIKLIIFASYWQGFFLSILVFLGAIPDDVKGYTRDNLAAAIQDALICVEMPIFAVAHWYAFSWHDFAADGVQCARMPLRYAFRDAFGVLDLVQDSKETFSGAKYGYRVFDSGDKVLAHEESESTVKRIREGMRYERGGKAKYWIPRPGEVNASSPLLGSNNGTSSRHESQGTFEELEVDPDDERLYDKARQLEYGDWNYPVITASEPFTQRFHNTSHHYRNSSPTETGWPDATRAGSVSTNSAQQKGKQNAGPPVVAVKAKKKPKKAIRHPEPEPQLLDFERGSHSEGSVGEATSSAALQESGKQVSAAREPSPDNVNEGYDVGEVDDPRKVWGSSP